MRFSYIATLLVSASAALASPFEELYARADQSAKVLADLKAEDAAGKKVNATFTAVKPNTKKPTSAQQTKILNANAALNKAIKKTTSDASASSAFSSTGSKNIADYVLNTLVGDVISILNNIEAHQPGFDAAGLSPIVVSTLQDQRKLVVAQGSAIQAKLTQPYKDQAPAAIKTITDKYDEAIDTYS